MAIDVKKVILFILALVLVKRSTFFQNALKRYRASKLKLINVAKHSTKFDAAIEAFKQNFYEGRERGAQLALTVDGSLLVDIKAGKDEDSVLDDLVMVFSCTKTMESLSIAMLVDRGLLNYEDPVAKYWPEFGEKISKTLTLAQLMRHEGGLEQIHRPISLKEAEEIFNDIHKLEHYILTTMKMDEDVARGERKARYHAITRGFFTDVIITRVYGKRARDFIRDEIVAKVPGAEFFLGIPPDLQHRMSKTEASSHFLETGLELLMHKLGIIDALYKPGPDASEEVQELYNMDFLNPNEVELNLAIIKMRGPHFKALSLITDIALGTQHLANSREFRAMPLLSVTGATNARSMALIGAAIVHPDSKLLSRDGLRRALEHNGKVHDELLNIDLTYSNCGWGRDRFVEGWIGWAGAGGSIFLFSPKHRASISYVPNRLESRVFKPNGFRILKQFNNALEELYKA